MKGKTIEKVGSLFCRASSSSKSLQEEHLIAGGTAEHATPEARSAILTRERVLRRADRSPLKRQLYTLALAPRDSRRDRRRFRRGSTYNIFPGKFGRVSIASHDRPELILHCLKCSVSAVCVCVCVASVQIGRGFFLPFWFLVLLRSLIVRPTPITPPPLS